MAKTATPVFAQNAFIKTLSLAAVSACTTRAPTVTASLAAANIFQLCDVSTNDRRIDKIQVNACSSSITAPTVAQIVQLWLWDGTSAYLFDEIQVTAQTPSTTSNAFNTIKSYDPLLLPSSYKLFASTTVTTTASTTALQVSCFGGDY
jgi:hypothetical protein